MWFIATQASRKRRIQWHLFRSDEMDSRFLVAFVAGGIAGACISCTFFHHRNVERDLAAAASVNEVGLAKTTSTSNRPMPISNDVHDEIVTEHFTRNIQFFGAEGQQRVASAFVVVVGLGGVGSHCAHMLLRSGVSRLRLVDFDQVSLSSLNRHAVANREDVGRSKAECLAAHFARIYPEASLDVCATMYQKEAEEELLGGEPDFVVDCIDNIDTKVELLAACVRRKIPVLACGGAGSKCDPTRIRIVDVAESVVDPLARAVRHRLKRDHGIHGGIPIIISTEKQRCDLVPIETEDGKSLKDYQVLPNFRIRTIPVFGALPAIFGMACAAHVVTTLAKQPFDSEPVFRMQLKQYETQLERLRDREDDKGSAEACLGVDLQDIVYLVKDIWHARSARDKSWSMSKGMWRSTAGLCLTRWNPLKPAVLDNLVFLTLDEADAHDTLMDTEGVEGLVHMREIEPDFVRFVEEKFDRVRREMSI